MHQKKEEPARRGSRRDEKSFFVWQSIHVHFNFGVFIHQLLIHALPPFSALLSPNPSAQGFWRLGFPMSVANLLLMSSTTTYSIILYFLMGYYTPDDYDHFAGFLFVPLLYSFVWRASIAIKYASFSPREYEKVMTVTKYEEIKAVFKQTFININYVDYEDEQTLDFEILACGLRVGCNVQDTYFTIENPESSPCAARKLEEWRAFLTANNASYEPPVFGENTKTVEEELIPQKDGTYTVRLFTVLKRIHRYTINRVIREWFFVSKLIFVPLCLSVILIPFYEITAGTYHVESPLSIIFLFLTVWELVFFQWVVIIRFALGCIVDMRRQAAEVDCFNALIRPTDYIDAVITTWSIPWPTGKRVRRGVSTKGEDALVERSERRGQEHQIELIRRVESQELLAKRLFNKLNKDRQEDVERRSTMRKVLPVVSYGPVTPDRPTPSNINVNGEGLSGCVSAQPIPFTSNYDINGHGIVNGNGNSNSNGILNAGATGDVMVHDDTQPTSQKSEHEGRRESNNEHENNYKYESKAEDLKGTSTNHRSDSYPLKVFNGFDAKHCTTVVSEDEDGIIGFPHLSLSFKDNLFSWLQATTSMQKFKLRFRKRIEACALTVLVGGAAVVLGIVQQIFTEPTPEGKLAAFETPLFFQTIFTVLTISLYILLYIFAASQVDDRLKKLLVTLSMHDISANKNIAAVEEEPDNTRFLVGGVVYKKAHLLQKLEQLSESIESCREVLKTNCESNPVEVFGLKAELGLAYGFFTVIVSFYVMLVGVYIQCKDGVKINGG